MTDVHSPETRSYNMSRILNKDTKPELTVRKFLFNQGYRYGLHNKKLPGKPDIVLTRYKTVVLIHGCFWHGHEGCKYFVVPKTRTEWWLSKIEGNRRNDVDNFNKLKMLGWKVLVIFECQLKNNLQNTLNMLISELH